MNLYLIIHILMIRYKKILVIKEQGIGDEILYGSMYSDLIKKYPNCIIETEERLFRIQQYR